MSAAVTAPETKPVGFEPDPLSERYSFLLGEMRLYAPAAPPSEWKQHPWRITTSNGWEGKDSPGLTYDVKPEHALEAWKHIALVQYVTDWHA